MPNNQTPKKIGKLIPLSKKTPSVKGHNYLFVIGINDYQDCPKLNNAVRDAKKIKEILINKFQFDESRTKELYNEEATARNIDQAFEFFIYKVTENDSLILYFSGHGEFHKIRDEGYWVPVEGERGIYTSYISNSDIKKTLGAVKSKHTFLMADSCFSGSLFIKGVARNVERRERDPSRWGLTAGRNEIVIDGINGSHSPFATSIIYKLEQVEKSLGVSQLCNHVLEVVPTIADQTPRGEPINISGHQGGQFIFHLKQDELGDWKNVQSLGTIDAYESFVRKYPSGQYTTSAFNESKKLKAEKLWMEIIEYSDENLTSLSEKDYLIRNYVDLYSDQQNYLKALELGELLNYKKEFFKSKNSFFSLRKFLYNPPPSVEGAEKIKQIAVLELNRLEEKAKSEKELKAKLVTEGFNNNTLTDLPPKNIIESKPQPIKESASKDGLNKIYTEKISPPKKETTSTSKDDALIQKQHQYTTLLEEGIRLYNNGNYKEAILKFENANSKIKDNGAADNWIERSKKQIKEIATTNYQKKNSSTSKSEQKEYKQHMERGFLHFQAKKYELAVESFQKAKVLASDNSQADSWISKAEEQLYLISPDPIKKDKKIGKWLIRLGFLAVIIIGALNIPPDLISNIGADSTEYTIDILDDVSGSYSGTHGPKTIDLSVSTMSDGTASGFNTVTDKDGKTTSRSLSGTVTKISNNKVRILLEEPGDDKWDGKFDLTFRRSGISITGSGTWKSNNGRLKRTVKISN